MEITNFYSRMGTRGTSLVVGYNDATRDDLTAGVIMYLPTRAGLESHGQGG